MRPLNQICLIINGGRGGHTSTSIFRALNRNELATVKHLARNIDSDRKFVMHYIGYGLPSLQDLLVGGKPISFAEADRLI